MRTLDIDTIEVSRRPGNHRRLLSLQTKSGEVLGVELDDGQAKALAEQLAFHDKPAATVEDADK